MSLSCRNCGHDAELHDLPNQGPGSEPFTCAHCEMCAQLALLSVEDVEEHVGEIMFDSMDRPQPDCLLCIRGVKLGVWARYGVDDPFAAPD